MWIASEMGFFSVVNKADSGAPTAEQASFSRWVKARAARALARRLFDANTASWHVRARVIDDLENLCVEAGLDPARITESRRADYRYRLVIGVGEYARVMSALGRSVNYSNFKSHIDRLPGQRDKHGAYESLWRDLGDLQPGGPYGWYERRPAGNVSGTLADLWADPEDGARNSATGGVPWPIGGDPDDELYALDSDLGDSHLAEQYDEADRRWVADERPPDGDGGNERKEAGEDPGGASGGLFHDRGPALGDAL